MPGPIVPLDPRLLALLSGGVDAPGLVPFGREIMLVECHVAGTQYRDLGEAIATVDAGASLALVREPDNTHDALAIKVVTAGGLFLGYVPRAKNEALARLLDAGKQVFGKLVQKQRVGDWWKIEVQLWMRDL